MNSVQGNPSARCVFRLKRDMPRGFIENPQYPELSAIYRYLQPYNNREFKSPDQFNATVLDKFLDYLRDQKVPIGADPKLRGGLMSEKLRGKLKSTPWDYVVYTSATNTAERYVFGGLEIISE